MTYVGAHGRRFGSRRRSSAARRLLQGIKGPLYATEPLIKVCRRSRRDRAPQQASPTPVPPSRPGVTRVCCRPGDSPVRRHHRAPQQGREVYFAAVLNVYTRQVLGYRSRITCTPSWSSTPYRWRSGAAQGPGVCVTPTGAASKPRGFWCSAARCRPAGIYDPGRVQRRRPNHRGRVLGSDATRVARPADRADPTEEFGSAIPRWEQALAVPRLAAMSRPASRHSLFRTNQLVEVSQTPQAHPSLTVASELPRRWKRGG